MVYTATKSVNENKTVDILGSAPSTAVLPTCGTFLETALYIGSVCEDAYTELMSSIGVSELAIYESTGVEVVYEAEDGTETEAKGNLNEKSDNFFKKIWNAIKGLFEKAVSWFQEQLKKHREKKTVKFEKLWNEKSKFIPEDKNFGKASYITAQGSIKRSADAFDASIHTVEVGLGEAVKKIIAGQEVHVFDAMIPAIQGVDSFAAFKEAYLKMPTVKTKEPVEITKKFVSDNLADICRIVIDGKDVSKIKQSYNKAKAFINKIAADLKKDANDYKTKAKGITSCLSALAAFYGLEVDIYKNRYVEASRILTQVSVALHMSSEKSFEKQKKDKEAAERSKIEYTDDQSMGESAIISAVEEAFNW